MNDFLDLGTTGQQKQNDVAALVLTYAVTQSLFIVPQVRMLTFEQLRSARTIDDKVTLLEQRYGASAGWSMVHLLIRHQKWAEVNEYITLLKTLPENAHQEQFRSMQNLNLPLQPSHY